MSSQPAIHYRYVGQRVAWYVDGQFWCYHPRGEAMSVMVARIRHSLTQA